MLLCRQGVYAFLRACYHSKSAGWPGNRPLCLNASTAELARMPTCNIMNPDRDTAQTVAAELASPGMVGSCTWLPEHELHVCRDGYKRTELQGGLQWYRCRTQAVGYRELQVCPSRTIDISSMFIAEPVTEESIGRPALSSRCNTMRKSTCAAAICRTEHGTEFSRKSPNKWRTCCWSS